MKRRRSWFSVASSVVLASLCLVGCSGTGTTSRFSGSELALTSISPNQVSVGSGVLTLRGFGSGFSAQSSLEWNGAALATQYVSSNEVDATVPSSDLTKAGTFSVSVIDPTVSTSGSSQTFIVTASMTNGNVQSLISIAADGSPGNGNSGPESMSSTGRYVAFTSYAHNLVAGSSGLFANVYLRDTCNVATTACTPATTLISVGLNGSSANDNSGENPGQVNSLAVSTDGRYVAFESDASNLVPSDTNGVGDIFVRDTCTGASSCTPSTILVSVTTTGAQANAYSANPAMSIDGRYVAFESSASNLVPGVTTGIQNIYLRDTCIGATPPCVPATVLISTGPSGTGSDGPATEATISSDGRFVAFAALAKTLVAGATVQLYDVYLRDACTGASGCVPSTSLVSVSNGGVEGNGASLEPSISSNGRFIAFGSTSSNLTSAGLQGTISNIFVRDTCYGSSGCTPTIIQIPSATSPGAGNGQPSISGDGTLVVYGSAPNAGTGIENVFAAPVCFTSTINCVPTNIELSTGPGGVAANFNTGLLSLAASGHWASFDSGASNLLPSVANGKSQVYLSTTTY